MKFITSKKIKIGAVLVSCFFIFYAIVSAYISDTYFREGEMFIKFNDKKASTGIVYKTVGWVIHKTYGENMNAIYWDDYAILMEGDNYSEIGRKELDDGRVETTFKVPLEEVNKALVEAGLGEIPEGQTIYLDAITETWDINRNQKRSGPHYTYMQIANAEEWGPQTMEDLKSRFNIPIVYQSAMHPLEKEIIIDGVRQPKESLLKDKTGTTHKVLLEESFEHGEKNVKLQSSHFYWNIQGADKKQFEFYYPDSKAIDRNPTIAAGGITVVAEYVSDDTPPPPTDPPTESEVEEGEDLEPNVGAVIKADNRGSEKFDVLQGIPTTEDLYANVKAKEYLYKYQFGRKSGEKAYDVTVSKTYNLTWQEDEGYSYTDHSDDDEGNCTSSCTDKWQEVWVTKTDSEEVSNTYSMTREFSYWAINNFAMYGIDKAVLNNYALPSETVTLRPKGGVYKEPSVSVDASQSESDHIKEPDFQESIEMPSETIDGGQSGRPSVPTEDWTSEAEEAVKEIEVKNDRLEINGSVIMDDSWQEKETSSPSSISNASICHNDALYQNSMRIDARKLNKQSAASTGKMHYKLIESVGSSSPFLEFNINGINPVTVHTPVVCYPTVYDDSNYNQKVNPDTGRVSIILDRPNNITLPTTGQHKSIKGYGYRDYEKYTERKQVKIPFDIYKGTSKESGTYIQANTWIDIPLSYDNMNFYTPIWVNEGKYDIEFRAIAINAPYDNSYEHNANKDLRNYVAYEKIPVEVVGRLYEFKITDIEDYPTWQDVFRVGADTLEHTKNYFTVGTKNQNGQNRQGATAQFTVPIINGSHPYKDNIGSVPTGYKFKFELTTIGNLYNAYDYINITPKFYYISKDGTKRQEVDLYYSENIEGKTKHFIKVGSTTDKKNDKIMRLGKADRNVPESEIAATAFVLGMDEELLKNNKTRIGYFSQVVLPSYAKMFTGSTNQIPSNVDPMKVKKSKQHWYGEYYLPNEVHAVSKNYDVFSHAKRYGLTGKENFWLKDGYIMVNFKIDTVKDGKFNNPDLSYYDVPLGNMWNIEGFINRKTDDAGVTHTFQRGDVFMYDLDRKASNDYKSGGTH